MDWVELRNGVEKIAAHIRSHDDLTEAQQDRLFPEITSQAVLIFGQTFVSIAESLHVIATNTEKLANPVHEMRPLPSTFEVGPQ